MATFYGIEIKKTTNDQFECVRGWDKTFIDIDSARALWSAAYKAGFASVRIVKGSGVGPCVSCGRPIPSPTADPFRCPDCR